MIPFYLLYFLVQTSALSLPGTTVLSASIDVVLTLSIDSGDGLPGNRHQITSKTSDDPFHWLIHPSRRIDALAYLWIYSMYSHVFYHIITIYSLYLQNIVREFGKVTTAECRYNTVQCNMVLLTPLQGLKQNINKKLKAQNTPSVLPWRASYGVYLVNILENKNNCVVTAPHSIMQLPTK